jgi:two-component system, OmpR family, response regulator MprA
MTHSILVVDDDREIAAILTEVLAVEGFDVRNVQDGATALHEISRAPPDLIISDVSMPFIDGVVLTKNLRARGIQIPIVLVSAALRHFDMAGVIFLAKPFDLDEMIGVVRQMLDDTG